eukprot:CFRG2277T1
MDNEVANKDASQSAKVNEHVVVSPKLGKVNSEEDGTTSMHADTKKVNRDAEQSNDRCEKNNNEGNTVTTKKSTQVNDTIGERKLIQSKDLVISEQPLSKETITQNSGTNNSEFKTAVEELSEWEEKHGRKEGDLPFWLWPKKGDSLKYPNCWRDKESPEKQDNPFEHHACHLWWWSWVVIGADRDTLNLPPEHRDELYERFGWKTTAHNGNRAFTEDDVEHTDYPEDIIGKLNILTVISKIGGAGILKRIYTRGYTILYFNGLCLTTIIIPSVWIIIIYGLIPVGDMRICEISEYAVWLFFTMPITALSMEVAIFSLLFAAVDPIIPWRPMWMYLPVMIFSYVSKVVIFTPIVLTVGSFSMLMLIVLTMSFLTVYGGSVVLKRPILTYDGYEGRSWAAIKKTLANNNVIDEKKLQRFTAFWKVMIVYYIAFVVYSGYLLVIKYGSSTVQTTVSVVIFFVEVAFRKFCQHIGSGLTRDINFLLAGLGVYTTHATFTVFSTPNIVDNTDSNGSLITYIILALKPLSDAFIAFFHQSELWFRFRNWVKKVAGPVFTGKRIDYMAIGIEEDVDFEGRGITNAHPDYRRAKCFFDILTFWGTMCGYCSFLCISWALYVGPNQYRFPYNDDTDLSIYGQENIPYTRRDFVYACIYASVVVLTLAVAAKLYSVYLYNYYPTIA